MNRKTLGVIGLAARARAVSIGSNQVLEVIRNKKAKLVLVAMDASDNTKKNLTDKAAYYKINIQVTDITAQELGRAVGHSHTAAIAFTDINFVKAYEKSLQSDLGGI